MVSRSVRAPGAAPPLGGARRAARAARALRRAAPRGAQGAGQPADRPIFRQTVTFDEPRTGARVTLVGCMHFNPWSIFTAEAVIKSAARGGGEGSGVGAVVIEQCSRRWKRTLDTAPTASLLRLLLANEMQAAADAAERHGARLVLGDQEVDALGKALKREALQTLRDLATPWDGGWGRVARDIRESATESFFSVPEHGLRATDLLDPRLVLAAPVTLLRYPAAVCVKAPAVGAAAVAWFAAAATAPAWVPDAAGALDGVVPESVLATFELLQLVVVMRIALSALLRERNRILADAIAEACRVEQEAARAEGRAVPREVVAILGAAHCNGVCALLTEASV